MEVWVRSQDKEKFLPIRGLRYKREEYKKTNEFGAFAEETQLFCDYDIVVKNYIYSDYYVDILGEYETKERCLEIIDEIQWLVSNNGSTEDRISAKFSGIQNNFIVYEMPKE